MGASSTPRAWQGGAGCGTWLRLGVTLFSVALAIAAISVWYHFLDLALNDTLSIAALLSIPPPGLFPAIKTLSIVTLTVCIVLATAIAALAIWRTALARAGSEDCAAAVAKDKGFVDAVDVPALAAAPARQRAAQQALTTAAACMLWLLLLWLVLVTALMAIWTGGGLILGRASADGVATLTDVDPAVSNLIKSASGGAIDTMSGPPEPFILDVGPPDAKREVDISNTTCGLMCFVLARTLMSDHLDCTCSPAILADMHTIAHNGWRKHLAPATAGALIAYAAGSFLLTVLAAQLGYVSGVMEVARGMWRRQAGGGAAENGMVVGIVDGEMDSCGVPLGESRVRSADSVERAGTEGGLSMV